MSTDLWGLYGLMSNPYFQETLSEASPHFPISLFVGRTEESRRLIGTLQGNISSRSTIAGVAGIGKTTLAQYVKSQARERGYVAGDDPVSMSSEEGPGELLLRIVSHIYEAILRYRPEAADSDPARTARDLLRAFRLRGYQGGVQAFGFGAHGGADGQVVRPVDAGIFGTVWQVGQQLVNEVQASHDAEGVVVHLNNFENLAGTRGVLEAARILRDLRDFFLTPYLHAIFVGTHDILVSVLTEHSQVRSIVPFPTPLDPLPSDQFSQLLDRRYEHLASSESEFTSPVEPDAAERVYELYRGDLRGALRALEEAAATLAGLGVEEAVEPIRFELIAELLGPRYRERLRRSVSESLFEKFETLADLGDETFIQSELADLWDVTPQRVSQLLPNLERLGYLQSVDREGRTLIYSLTGTGRLALELDL